MRPASLLLFGASLLFAAIALITLAVLPTSATQAASADVVSTAITPDTATVGDRLTLTIVVEHDEDVTIDAPGFGADFGGLEPTAVAPPSAEQHAGRTRTTLGYSLVAFKPGDYTVPSIRIAWRGADGATGAATTESRTIHINSVLAPGESELRPLKPQIELDEPAPPAILPVLFVAIFAALTVFGYSLVARAINTRPARAARFRRAPEPPPAHVRARESLEAIAGASDDLPAYYAGIAATIRRYLSERFDFAAYAMTRTELERAASGAGIGRWPARLTANLLEQCDAVQFAGFRPAPERAAADLNAAYEIIELTAQSGDDAGATYSPLET